MNRELLDRIKKEIVDSVSLTNEMEKRGIEIFQIGCRKKSVCPFHGDTDPSLVIYEEDHPHAHCFGCGIHFDVIGFVAEWESRKNKNWSFKKTLSYFKDNYKIKSISSIDDMDNSFLEEENFDYEKQSKRNQLIKGDYYRNSNVIKKALKDSPFPEFDLKKIKPFLKKLDEASFDSEYEPFKHKEKSLLDFIAKLNLSRYPENLTPYCRNIIGNIKSKKIIISDESSSKKILKTFLKMGGNESELLFFIINGEKDKDAFKEIIRSCPISDCFIVGEKPYYFLFEKSIKTVEELSGSKKIMKLFGKEINFHFIEDKNIKKTIIEKLK